MRQIRSASPEDWDALAEIFYLAVHRIAKGAYTDAQCQAWCPAPPAPDLWAKRLQGLDIVVAEVEGALVGFIGLNFAKALVDFAYIHPDHVRSGHASALYAVIEGRARQARLPRLTTEASRLAQPFFLSQGWQVEAFQEVARKGVLIPNARMAKNLDCALVGMAFDAAKG